jgi:hypothetical protein
VGRVKDNTFLHMSEEQKAEWEKKLTGEERDEADVKREKIAGSFKLAALWIPVPGPSTPCCARRGRTPPSCPRCSSPNSHSTRAGEGMPHATCRHVVRFGTCGAGGRASSAARQLQRWRGVLASAGLPDRRRPVWSPTRLD